MSDQIALNLLQLVALAVPPVAVLLKMLRKSENLSWTTRKFSFGLALSSIVSFIGAGIAVLVYFLTKHQLPFSLQLGLLFGVLGLVPFAVFTAILYREHKRTYK